MAPITLRDGSTVLDPRLDWIPFKDERSRAYAAVDIIPDVAKPRFRNYMVNKWLDQGTDGACVGFAFTHEICSTPKRIRNWREIDARFAFDIYHEAQHIDPWPGCALGTRCPIEASSHRYDGTSTLAGVRTLQNRGLIGEYRWAFGEEDLALAISHLGPAVIGVNWYEGMFEPNRHNFLEVSGQLAGGHAIVVAGVNPKTFETGHYRVWNSWGRGWGRNGWANISRKDMARLLGEWGEACIPLERV